MFHEICFWNWVLGKLFCGHSSHSAWSQWVFAFSFIIARFSVCSWKQLVTALWVPVIAHLSRRLPQLPLEGQMPGEAGTGVEVVCVMGV